MTGVFSFPWSHLGIKTANEATKVCEGSTRRVVGARTIYQASLVLVRLFGGSMLPGTPLQLRRDFFRLFRGSASTELPQISKEMHRSIRIHVAELLHLLLGCWV